MSESLSTVRQVIEEVVAEFKVHGPVDPSPERVIEVLNIKAAQRKVRIDPRVCGFIRQEIGTLHRELAIHFAWCPEI